MTFLRTEGCAQRGQNIYHSNFKRSHFSVPEALQSAQVKWKKMSPANWLGLPDFKQPTVKQAKYIKYITAIIALNTCNSNISSWAHHGKCSEIYDTSQTKPMTSHLPQRLCTGNHVHLF